jgi:hypothetical protein
VRTSRASLRQVGVLTNRHLLRGVAFAIVFAAAIIYAPPLQSIFSTAALPPHDLLVLACFPRPRASMPGPCHANGARSSVLYPATAGGKIRRCEHGTSAVA